MTRETILRLSVLVLAVVLPVLSAEAQVEQLTLRVDGLACPFCAYGLEKKIKKLEGYKSFEVFINQGKVNLGWHKDKPLDLVSINQAVVKAGFTLRGVKGNFIGKLVKEGKRIFLQLDGTVKQYLYLYEPSAVKNKAENAHKLEGGPEAFNKTMWRRLERLAAGSRTVRIVGPVHTHRDPNRPMVLGIEKLSVKEVLVGVLTKEKGRFFLVVSQPTTRRFRLYEPRKLKLVSEDAHELEGADRAFSETTWKRLGELLAKKKTVKVIGEIHEHRAEESLAVLGIEKLEIVLPGESMKSPDLGSAENSGKAQYQQEEK